MAVTQVHYHHGMDSYGLTGLIWGFDHLMAQADQMHRQLKYVTLHLHRSQMKVGLGSARKASCPSPLHSLG